MHWHRKFIWKKKKWFRSRIRSLSVREYFIWSYMHTFKNEISMVTILKFKQTFLPRDVLLEDEIFWLVFWISFNRTHCRMCWNIEYLGTSVEPHMIGHPRALLSDRPLSKASSRAIAASVVRCVCGCVCVCLCLCVCLCVCLREGEREREREGVRETEGYR